MSLTNKRIPAGQVKSDATKRPKGRKRPQRRGRMQIYGDAATQAGRDAKAALSLARAAFSMLNVEDKYIDVGATVTLSGAWQIVLLNPLSLGTTSTTRTGQSVKITGWEFKWFVTINAVSTSPQSFRIVVVWDSQTNGGALTGTDVYPAASASFRVVGYLGRFNVLYDEWCTLSPGGDTLGRLDSISRALNRHTMFNTGNAGTVADITSGSIYLMFFSDAGANFPAIVYNSRVVFVDN